LRVVMLRAPRYALPGAEVVLRLPVLKAEEEII
jgi:hypothetical protein